jgi:hypothetical protein
MEALQMVKFHLKKECLNFTLAWITTEEEMTDDVPEDDLLGSLLDDDFQDSLDRAILSLK